MTLIEKDAFDGSPKVRLVITGGSYAETIAKEQGIAFEVKGQ